MVNFIKKHKILSIIVGVILIGFIFILIASGTTSTSTTQENSTPEPLSNFKGYWQSGGVYMDIGEAESVHFVIDNSDKSQLFNGSYSDDEDGGSINFDAETSWDCTCYKEGDNGLNMYFVASSDNEGQDLAFTRIDENTFNEAKSKVETYLADKGTNQTENTTSGYEAGTYKVGTDMPAGEYVLTSSKGSGYVSVSSDSSGEFDSLIDNDNFGVQDYLIVNDGEYVTLGSGVTATPIDEAEVYSGTLSDGVFKVGRDIPAGEYQLSASGGSGYWERNSSGVGSSNEIIANDNFENSTYVTVEDGEYLQLSNHTTLTK